MDHADVLEILELAAVEPGGLERLMAGDTADAAAVASHLAGCPDCTREHLLIARTATILSDTLGGIGHVDTIEAPAGLRARTLDYVKAVGRPRGDSPDETGRAGVAAAADRLAIAGPAPAFARPGDEESGGSRHRAETLPVDIATVRAPIGVEPSVAARRRDVRGGSRSGRFGPILAIAAVLVIAVLGAGAVVRGFDTNQLSEQSQLLAARAQQVDALTELTNWSIRVTAQADAQHVRLSSASGDGAGFVLYSPSSGDVVVLMTGFTPPASGTEYRCWVQAGGKPDRIGKMFFEGGFGYWVGPTTTLRQVGPGATFGVNLVDLSTGQQVGGPVLTGTLGA